MVSFRRLYVPPQGVAYLCKRPASIQQRSNRRFHPWDGGGIPGLSRPFASRFEITFTVTDYNQLVIYNESTSVGQQLIDIYHRIELFEYFG